LLDSEATLANAELETKDNPLDKVFSYQSGKIYLTGTVKGADRRNRSEKQRQEQIKGTDQGHNVRGRSKGPIRDATSGVDQRRQIRAATKKPAIRGPTKIKNQHGSEEHAI
jgi:hypothetical protein